LPERVRAALLDSARQHLVGDVPIALFLSSGIDSGALLGLIREARDDIHTITIAHAEFRGAPQCEAAAAAQLAARSGVPHSLRVVSESEFRDDLPHLLNAMDQPSIDGINTWFASKAARELGFKVALSGLGGDELFGGYPSFADIPRWVRLMALPSRVPLLGEAFQMAVSAMRRVHPAIAPKAAGLVKYAGSYAGAYLLRRGVFLPGELADVMEAAAEGLRRLDPLRLIAASGARRAYSPTAKVAVLEAALYLRNQLLRDTDWAGMAQSVEVRVPLVDIALARSVGAELAALPAGEGKRLLAASPLPRLPRDIVEAPKRGFETPIALWMQRDARLQAWRGRPALSLPGCPWARRWSYQLAAAA
jgi:asparagine synthase (glutamine-hydrolysing)